MLATDDPDKIAGRLRSIVKSLDGAQESGMMALLRGDQAALFVACMPDEAGEPDPPKTESEPAKTSKPVPTTNPGKTRKTKARHAP
jgi:hypothetical protein